MNNVQRAVVEANRLSSGRWRFSRGGEGRGEAAVGEGPAPGDHNIGTPASRRGPNASGCLKKATYLRRFRRATGRGERKVGSSWGGPACIRAGGHPFFLGNNFRTYSDREVEHFREGGEARGGGARN